MKKMHNNCKLLPSHIVCKITQRLNTGCTLVAPVSAKHNTQIPGPPLQTLVQARYQLPTYTTTTKTHRHTSNTPHFTTVLVKSRPNPLIHSTPPPLHQHRPSPNTYTSHIIHQLFTSHAPHSSLTRQLRYAPYLNHVYHPHAPHTSSIPHTSIAFNLTPPHSLSRHTCNTNNGTRITVTATTSST